MTEKLKNRLQSLRMDRGLSQEALAELVGTNKGQISKLERSERRLSNTWLERLAAALQCHPLELIDDALPAVTADEKAVLQLYRGLDESQQRAFLQFTASMQKPADAASEPARDPGRDPSRPGRDGDPASRPRRSAA